MAEDIANTDEAVEASPLGIAKKIFTVVMAVSLIIKLMKAAFAWCKS